MDTWTNKASIANDLNAQHIIITQSLSKLRNIKDESRLMMTLQKQVMEAYDTFIQDRKAFGADLFTPLETSLPKAQQQLRHEQEKIFKLLIESASKQKKQYLNELMQDRKDIFHFHQAATKLMSEIDQSDSAAPQPCLQKIQQNVTDLAHHYEMQAFSLDDTPERTQWNRKTEEYSTLDLHQGQWTASSNAHLTTLAPIKRSEDSQEKAKNHAWMALPTDESPFIQLKFPTPIEMHTLHLQGVEDTSVPESKEVAQKDLKFRLTFQTKEELVKVIDTYSSQIGLEQDDVVDDVVPELAYEIIGHLLSWETLLKTTKIPMKLFLRPPIRFLHDVFSHMIHNTCSRDTSILELTAQEQDYGNIESKADRVSYLSKLIQFVQTKYPNVQVDANEIVSGKESAKTRVLMCTFALMSMSFYASHHAFASSDQESCEATPREDLLPGPAWITEFQLEWTMRNEVQEEDSLDFECMNSPCTGCTDATNPAILSLQDQSIRCTTLRLRPLKWQHLPVLQLQIDAYELRPSDTTLSQLDQHAAQYDQTLDELVGGTNEVLTKVKARVQRMQDSQKESEQELTQMKQQFKALSEERQVAVTQAQAREQELLQLRRTQEILEREKKVLETSVSTLHQTLDAREHDVDELAKNLNQVQSDSRDLVKQLGETQAASREAQTTLESLEHSKSDLEAVNAQLREQLENLKSSETGERLSSSRVSLLETDLHAKILEFEHLHREFTHLREKLEVLEAQKRQAEDASAEATTQRLEHEAKIASSATKVAQLERTLEEASQKARDDAMVKARWIEERQALQQELDHECQHTRKLVSQVESLQAQVDVVSKNSASASAEEARLETENQNLRLEAEKDRLAQRCQGFEAQVGDLKHELEHVTVAMGQLKERQVQLEDAEQDAQEQLQVLLDERDSSRQKEEQLFIMNADKDEEIERARDGYVWVTDRLNEKEDELNELQDQIERYQSLLDQGHSKDAAVPANTYIATLYQLAFHQEFDITACDATVITSMFNELKKKCFGQEGDVHSTSTSPGAVTTTAEDNQLTVAHESSNEDDYEDDEYEDYEEETEEEVQSAPVQQFPPHFDSSTSSLTQKLRSFKSSTKTKSKYKASEEEEGEKGLYDF